jgi:hypothetical protein
MSYEIEYSDLESPSTIKKAVNDCKQWLGVAQFKKVCKILADDQGQSPAQHVRIGLMMQGIQGYPAKAMMDTFWKKAE